MPNDLRPSQCINPVSVRSFGSAKSNLVIFKPIKSLKRQETTNNWISFNATCK